MRLYNINGRLVKKPVSKYLINWDGPSKSKLQFKVKQFFKKYWKGHICYEEFPVYGSLLRVDLLNATLKIAIEVQGQQHEKYHYFHNKSPFNYLESIKKDVRKQDWLNKNNFKFIEINYNEVENLSKEFIKKHFNLLL